jgi:hypothetical protein
VRFDPWRALVVLAIAGSLIVVPPAAGYAMGALDPGFGARPTSGALQYQQSLPPDAVRGVFNDNDNVAEADNDNAAPDVNDNDDNDNAAAAPAPAAPAPDESTDNPAYHWHNDPNNNGT